MLRKIVMLCGIVALPCVLMAENLPEYKSEADKIKVEAVTEVCIDYVKKEYYDNGKLKYEAPFKRYEAFYPYTEIEGMLKWYYKNGKFAAEIPHKKYKEGIVKLYKPNGKLLVAIPYHRALRDKAISVKCSNGKVLNEEQLQRIDDILKYFVPPKNDKDIAQICD